MLLAAGAGRRMGRPKALVRGSDGTPWIVSAARALLDGGCSPVIVVLGAAVEEPRRLLDGLAVEIVEASDWSEGMGASLRAGLSSLDGGDAVVIHLVDLPDVDANVVARLVAHAAPDAIVRADFGEGPAHPVLIGRDHWDGVRSSAHGDRGARDYLRARPVLSVDCSDLAMGRDVDEPPSRPGAD